MGITLNSHMLKKIAIIISYILHPMVVSSFTFWFIIYKTGLSLENPGFIFFLSIFLSTALTIITVIAFIKMNLVKYTLEKLAEIKNISSNELDEITSQNFNNLFT